jgi:hypothetical protein
VKDQDYKKFPGPRPYEEHLHYLFFGREREVERMITATRERLGVLSAESGAGKSSLLEAGYIPALRKLRATKRGVPPVLLLRTWGGRASGVEDRILEGTREAIRQLPTRSKNWEGLAGTMAKLNDSRSEEAHAIARSIDEDYRKLNDVFEREVNKTRPKTPDEGEDLRSVFAALCDTEGLILILDQFEEFMGSASAESGGDRTPAEKVTQAVGRLFRDVPKIRIFISLRTEYCQRLQRYLNIFVPSLASRIINLSPLPPQSIVQIVEGVSGQSGPEIEAFARSLALASGATEEGAEADGDSTADTRLGLRPLGSFVSVLELQALLFGFDAWCTKQPGGVLDFTPSQWKAYADTLRERPALLGETADPELGRNALKKWVTDQLETAVCSSRRDIDPAGQRARWLLLPVLPRLSTHGGYKQHLPLMGLVLDLADRLSDGYGKLEIVKQRVQSWMDNDRKDVLRLNLEVKDLGEPEQTAAPSGEAVGLVEECIRDFMVTIDELRKADLLKLSGNAAAITCELVHDGLSEHVRKWSDDLPKNAETTLGCPVEVVGESFGWRELVGENQGKQREIEGKKWIGCTVSARIRNVKFRNCDFRGLAFKQCTLENVSFEDCKLPGAITIGGTFTRIIFNDCTLMSASFIEVSFGGKTEFSGSLPKLGLDGDIETLDESKKQSDLKGIQFHDCTMLPSAKMEFTECVLRFAMIGGITNNPEKGWRFSKCDMMNAWVEDAGTPSVEVDQYCRTIGLLSFTLPMPAWLERRKS